MPDTHLPDKGDKYPYRYTDDRPPAPLEVGFDDESGEVCVSCGGPHFDCTDPANWDDE